MTDTSVQIAWDRAEGDFQQYEVTCTNCASAFRVCFLKDCSVNVVIFVKFYIKHSEIKLKAMRPTKIGGGATNISEANFANSSLFGFLGPESQARDSNIFQPCSW